MSDEIKVDDIVVTPAADETSAPVAAPVEVPEVVAPEAPAEEVATPEVSA